VVVGGCAFGTFMAAIPSHKHNGPCCLVVCVPRQEGKGFDPVCVGKGVS
jgi:hypothetical protein